MLLVKQQILLEYKDIFLSVGGATYPWYSSTANYSAMVSLAVDLGLDGIDIDYEIEPSCSGIDTSSPYCSTDDEIITIIKNLKSAIKSAKANLLITAAVYSVGAYGTTDFPQSTYFKGGSKHTGMWVNPLLKAGDYIDGIFVMSYDAGTSYNSNDAFDAYKNIYDGKIWTGLEVPPEAWGGHELTSSEAINYFKHNISNGGNGIFIWSLQTTGTSNDVPVDAFTYLDAICKEYEISEDC